MFRAESIYTFNSDLTKEMINLEHTKAGVWKTTDRRIPARRLPEIPRTD